MTPFDLHALGTPPALILSQDQTLHQIHPAHQISRCLKISGSHGACSFRCPPHQSTQRARPHDPAHHALSTSALLLLPLQRLTQLCSGQISVRVSSSLLNPRCQASRSPSQYPHQAPRSLGPRSLVKVLWSDFLAPFLQRCSPQPTYIRTSPRPCQGNLEGIFSIS